MKCENKFCVYQNERKCIFDETEIDDRGVCEKYIPVKIDDVELKKLKNDSTNDLVYIGKEKLKKNNHKLHLE